MRPALQQTVLNSHNIFKRLQTSCWSHGHSCQNQ